MRVLRLVERGRPQVLRGMCVAVGAGIALEYSDVILRSQPTEEESLVGMYPG